MVSSSASIRHRRRSRASSFSSTRRQQQHYSQRHRGQSIRTSSVNASLPIQTTVQQRYAPSDLRLQQRQRHLLYPSTQEDNHHRRVFLSPASASHSSYHTDTLLVTIPSSTTPMEPAPDFLRRRPQHTSRQSSPSTPSLSRDLRNRTPPSSPPTSSRSAYHQLSLQPALSSSRQSTPRSQRQVRFSAPISAVTSRCSPSPPAHPWHSSARMPSPAPLGKTCTRSPLIRTSSNARRSHYGPLPSSSPLSIHARTRSASRPPSPRPSHYCPSPLSLTRSTERSADKALVARRHRRSPSPFDLADTNHCIHRVYLDGSAPYHSRPRALVTARSIPPLTLVPASY
jgi:hypothetical protein